MRSTVRDHPHSKTMPKVAERKLLVVNLARRHSVTQNQADGIPLKLLRHPLPRSLEGSLKSRDPSVFSRCSPFACPFFLAGAIEETQANNGYKIDLLLICGDFQACRNEQDLECMVIAHVSAKPIFLSMFPHRHPSIFFRILGFGLACIACVCSHTRTPSPLPPLPTPHSHILSNFFSFFARTTGCAAEIPDDGKLLEVLWGA